MKANLKQTRSKLRARDTFDPLKKLLITAIGASDMQARRMEGKQVVSVEEEEDLVVVKFNGLLLTTDEDCRNRLNNCQFHNLDTDQPVIQVGRQFFRGTLDNILGTAVCFEVPRDEVNDDLKYVGKTEKSLVMSRVFLESKSKKESTQESMEGAVDDSARRCIEPQAATSTGGSGSWPCAPSLSEEESDHSFIH